MFKLNAETFPQSENVWDSLAEAYMKAGDVKKAEENYEKISDTRSYERKCERGTEEDQRAQEYIKAAVKDHLSTLSPLLFSAGYVLRD